MTFLLCRSIYLLLAFLLGFGSSGDHLFIDISLNLGLCLFNIFICLSSMRGKGIVELISVSLFIIILWLVMFIYYNQILG